MKPYRSGKLGVAVESFATACAEARTVGGMADTDARSFFERHFVPGLIAPETGSGFGTGVYGPAVEAAPGWGVICSRGRSPS